jgi:hypothetical protein
MKLMTTRTPLPSVVVPSPTAPVSAWPNLALGIELGVAWWAALLIPGASRTFLIEGTAFENAWAFTRVVGLVALAGAFFRYAHRRLPRLSWLTAVACLWGGSVAFVATLPKHMAISDAFLILFVAPVVFVGNAWFIALPMTTLTAVLLARATRRPPFAVNTGLAVLPEPVPKQDLAE